MKLNSVERNAIETVRRTCKIADIKATSSGLQDKLLQHPTFPSMQSLRDTFTSLNVPNLAARIEPAILDKIPTPLIVYLDGGLGYAIVQKVENDFVEWYHNDLGTFRENRNEFSRKWQGISLVIEPDKRSGESDFFTRRSLEINEKSKKIIGISATVILLIFWLFSNQKTLAPVYYLLVLIHLAGIIISTILIRTSMNKYEDFWRKGYQMNFPTSSERVLRSPIGRIIPRVSWPEICLLFFTGGLLFLLTSKNYTDAALPLQLLSFGALLSAFWLIFVQLKLRSICVGCLGITILIVSELWLLSDMNTNYRISSDEGIQFGISFLLPVIAWMFMKGPLEKAALSGGHYNKIKQMMFDPSYLRSILSERKDVPPSFSGMSEMYLGLKTANDHITLVLNPICHICRNTFLQMHKLISDRPEIKCEIIFAVSSNPESIDNMAATSILGSTAGSEVETLKDWYTDMPVKVKEWFKSRNSDLAKGSGQLTHHSRWSELAGLHSELPIILLNGAELPKIYNASDINKILSIRFSKDLVGK